jgi:hypothetical protein
VGDVVHCPLYYPDGTPHGANKIVDGSSKTKVDGIAAALIGSVTECGSKIAGPSSSVPLALPPSNATEEEKKHHLFGDQRPDMEKLMQDQGVSQSSDEAWNNTLKDGKEHGFYITYDMKAHTYGTQTIPTGSTGMMNPQSPPADAIGIFHTHPPRTDIGSPMMYMPSSADVGNIQHNLNPAFEMPLNGVVRTAFGYYFYFYGTRGAVPVAPGAAAPPGATYTPSKLDPMSIDADTQKRWDTEKAQIEQRQNQQNSQPPRIEGIGPPDGSPHYAVADGVAPRLRSCSLPGRRPA